MPAFEPPATPTVQAPVWDPLDEGAVASVVRPSVSDDVVAAVVGHNLKRLRKRHRWTLEALSQQCGVSRAMLGQVEQGKSVPSIKTLWQVAQAFGVSVAWFLEANHDDGVLLIRPTESSPSVLRPGDGELRTLNMSADARLDEFHELRLAPGAVMTLPAPLQARRVNVAVSTGVLDCVIEGELYRVQPREAIQWQGVQLITWRNSGEAEVQAYVVFTPV